MKTKDNQAKDITWEEIQEYINNNESYKEFFGQIPLSIYKMARNKKDRPKVVKAIMKVLHENGSTSASEEYAQIIAERMQKMAQQILKSRNRK